MMMSTHPGGLGRSHAEIMADEKKARDEKRSLDLAELRSDLNTPEARIRIWEKLHALRLPSDPGHPVLEVIAASARLTLAQVQEEQRLRAQRATHQPPG